MNCASPESYPFVGGKVSNCRKISYNQGAMKSTLRLNTRLLPTLVIALVIMQLVDPSRVWTVLLVGLGGLWLISFVWAWHLSKHLSILREMRYGWVQVGDMLEERFTLKNTGALPATWVEIEDRSTLPGYDASLATGVDSSGKNQWRRKGVCERRGLYQLGNTSLNTGDPFGIYSVTITDPSKATLMVMPPVVPLPDLEIAPGGYSGEGRPLPDAPERTVSASSVREYVPGDSLRLVHWKTTARRAKPYVRLFDGTPAGDWWILLDLQAASQVGSGGDSTEELGVILAASLADRGLRANRGVGLVLNAQRLDWLPAHAGSGQRWEILRRLALVSPGERPLGDVLEHIRPNLGQNTSLLIITPTRNTDWFIALPHLARRGIRPTVLLFDLNSFDSDLDNSMVAAGLKKVHVPCHMLPRELFDQPEARPGSRGVWEWRISPLGHAVPVRAPKDQQWKRLAK
jgi:uncharacterized protein (DUF58 family)